MKEKINKDTNTLIIDKNKFYRESKQGQGWVEVRMHFTPTNKGSPI